MRAESSRTRFGRPLLRVLVFLTPMAVLGQQPALRAQRVEREYWFLRGRMLPGQVAASLRHRAYMQKMQVRASGLREPQRGNGGRRQAPSSGWVPLGPVPLTSDASGNGQQDYNWVSGRATAVAVDPADPTAGTVYVGGAYAGVWKSTNATSPDPANVAWTPLTDDQATLAVGAIAIQPQLSNPDPTRSLILAGTGEANSSFDSYYGLGILRSPDAGKTWSLISSDISGMRSFAGMAFSKLAFSTSNPNVVVATTAGASQGILEGLADPITANLGLYASSDGGTSWTFATVKDGNAITEPGSGSTVVYNSGAGRFFAALRYHGFYSSSDGIHWTRLSNQPGAGLSGAACPANPHSTNCPLYRAELATVSGRNEMYAWFVDRNDNDQGIWKSTDGGNSWMQLNDSGITNCGDPEGCGTQQGAYNLELAAVPDGGATDLYAGAINIYTCQITLASPNCAGTGSNTFLNLTHAYGCSSIARVHPSQHSLSFLLNASLQSVLYFANDGGIYRALDGYTGLNSTDCGGTNQFESLNQTLGSMTQLVGFAQSPSDFNTILAGAQGNGSPATQSALANTAWLNVNAGDGGYSQINPNDANEWFVSNPPNSGSGINIFRCASGINCHTQDFQNDQVVSSASVGGDTGGYYPVYDLDPQNPEEMIVGTCRVWRGASQGGGFALLSDNFETGGSGICTGGETNRVRSLAAGGPLDSHGFSNAMYAGTDGFGPLIPTLPPGGRVWVSTNVAGGSTTWVDRTGGINPGSFPISGIALDSSDPTGLTAYVSIMGFHTSHVWKTADGGVSWFDFTANLPDAPADTVLVDSGSSPLTGTIYLATDAGVFSSPTASPNWTEVGPAPGSGEPGFLPNVAVTALHMLDTGNSKLLRASTYGRGIWQFPVFTAPDYSFYISDTPMTLYAGSQGIFHGEIFALGGYKNQVLLRCTTGVTAPPPNCLVVPGNPLPTNSGTAFTIAVNGPVASYTFNLHGDGTDPDSVVHDSSVTLNVVDFGLSAPSPKLVTVGPGDVSPPVKFQVTAAGIFNKAVTLACSGLPAGARCRFQPSDSVNPTDGKPVAVTLTISTAADTTAGEFPVVISGSVADGPTKTQNLTLIVINDYSLTIHNPLLTAYENAIATFNGTLTTLNGYTSPVGLSCGPGAPPTCTVAPSTVIPTLDGADFTVTVSSNQCGQYNFDVVARGTDSLQTSHSVPVTFNSQSLAPPDYTLSISNPFLSSPVNTPATFDGSLTSTACYNYPVQLSCGSGAPPSCAVSPTVLVPTIAGARFTVKVASDKVQVYNFGTSGEGSDPGALQHVALVTFTSTSTPDFDYSLSNDSGSEAVTAGGTATFRLSVTPKNGKFPDSVTLTYAACPPLSACSLSPPRVNAGQGATAVVLTVQTTAAVGTNLHAWPQVFYALWFCLPGLVLCTPQRRPRRGARLFFSLALTLILLGSILSCGGGGLQGGGTAAAQPGTPAETYTMTITATMNGLPTRNVFVTLTVN